MNGAHLHLLVNHVSLFALIIGTCVLIASMKRKSTELRVTATVLFVAAGIFGWVAAKTGGEAAHVLKTLGDGYKPFIHEHAMAAMWARRSGFFVGTLALVTEWAIVKKKNWFKPLQWILLIGAIHGCTVFARTAWLGGMIRHSEIRSPQPITVPTGSSQVKGQAPS